jgi:hypothetical protein
MSNSLDALKAYLMVTRNFSEPSAIRNTGSQT